MSRRGILLAASILVAAVGTALIAMYVAGADGRAQARYSPVTVWMVNTRDFPAGATIADVAACACLTRAQVGPEAASDALNPFTAPDSGRRALGPIARGTILRTVEFGMASASSSGGATVVLPLTAESAPAGLKQGDHVDILAQSQEKPVIAQDVVLRSDARYESDSQIHLELLVTPDQAAAITAVIGRNQLTVDLELPATSS